MPKGQYQRKPRAPKVETPIVAMAEPRQYEKVLDQHWDKTADGVFEPREGSPPDVELERIAALLTQPVAPFPLPERTSETFDDWMDDEPAVVPAHSRIAQMVGEWASLVCPIQHNVFWEVSSSGRELLVELNTEHGTSNLHADAGDWNEADIVSALAAMRVQLGV